MIDGKTLEAKPAAFLVAIVCVGAILRYFAFSGYAGGDDAIYTSSAVELSRGDLWVNKHWQARIGITGPLALIYEFFGFNFYFAAVLPFISSLA